MRRRRRQKKPPLIVFPVLLGVLYDKLRAGLSVKLFGF